MKIEADPIELILILTGLQNMFNDLTPSMFQKFVKGESEDERVLIRQRILKERIIEILEKGLDCKLDLYKGTTPFTWESDAICEKLNLNPSRRKK